MHKRIVVVFTAFCLSIGLLIVNMLTLYNSEYTRAASVNSSKTLTVSQTRGNIYDCNMKKLVNIQTEYTAAVKPTAEALAKMSEYLDGDGQRELAEKLSKGYPAMMKISVPYIDCEDISVVKTVRRYSDNQILRHTLGYLDQGGVRGASGLEYSYNDLLSSFKGSLSISYTADAAGRILAGSKGELKYNGYQSKGGIKLTIDERIQRIAEECVEQAQLGECAVVVLEAGTGKIKAMVSKPDFDPYNIGKSMNESNSPLINRALTAYSVGSVFKLVVAAAAVEKGIPESLEYTCTGSYDAQGVIVHCHKLDGHGTLNMSDALALSCNTYFINLANKTGAAAIIDMAERMGIGGEIKLAPSLTCEKGVLPSASDINSPAALANLSFGQGTLMATPLQLAAVYSCVANNGRYYQPFLVEATIDGEGRENQVNSVKAPVKVFDERISKKLTSFLKNSVDNGGGSLAKPSAFTAAGKTATAQTGWYGEDATEYYHAWFCGFYPAENPRYVIAVMKDKGKGGSVDCAPVFKKIADRIG